ncbi:MAG TPA: hypothetical protein VHM26_04450 [Chitinophagaceae bacterium]|jgi:hypothetical protein|nr:hypothetical protein [Chitinophagaceae bacterium]
MIRDFEEEKRKYLQQIEEKHNPPDDGYSFLRFGNTCTYTPSTKFTSDTDFSGVTLQELDVCNNKGGCYLAIAIYSSLSIMAIIWKPEQWWQTIGWAITSIIIIRFFAVKFQYKPGEKIHLRLTIHGIWIAKRDHVIKWNYLVWSGIEDDKSYDDRSDILLLYYYDERSDEWTKFEIEISKLCINHAELFFYIEYFKKMSEDIHTQTKTENK